MDALSANIAQPDITLRLDMEGVITDVSFSGAIPEETGEAWLGQRWAETVEDVGGEKVQRMVEDARASGVSGFRQVNQRFPSGLELPIEYTTVKLGRTGLLAIGKSLEAVADLQSRLIAAQQAMERDYWKMREVETRYRLLFDASTEAVLLIRASNLHVVEANPSAIRALGFAPTDRNLLPELESKEQEQFKTMLDRVRDQGKAPAIILHLGQNHVPWMVRASLMISQPAPLFLVQLSPVGGKPALVPPSDAVSTEDVVMGMPDGFVVLDPAGTILSANPAFLDLVQVGAEKAVIGERLGRWLGRPGADVKVLLANVQKSGYVRIFSTALHGELGTDCQVEISAAGSGNGQQIGVLIRDVGQRLPEPSDSGRLHGLMGSLTEQVGKKPLRRLIADATGVLEQHYIEAALELTEGHRSAAAELLGVSRQSLYTKLNKYGLDGGS